MCVTQCVDIDQIKFFNIEIGLFLRYVQAFSNIDNVEISSRTEYLLQNARHYIDHILSAAKTLPTDETDDEFLFDLDERLYEFRRYIFCQTCNVSAHAIVAQAAVMVWPRSEPRFHTVLCAFPPE